MSDAAGTARRVLFNSAVIDAELSRDEAGVPNVAVGWLPAGTRRPYVLLNYNDFSTETPYLRTGPLTVDIFTDGPSTVQARRLRDAIVATLDSTTMTDEAGHIYRTSEMQQDGPAPTEADDVTHWVTAFNVRYWRMAFLEARYGGDAS